MAIARNTLKQILLDNQKDVEQYTVFPRQYDIDSFPFQCVGQNQCADGLQLCGLF